MALYAAWNNQHDIKQRRESLLLLSLDRTIGLMAMTDSFGSLSDDEVAQEMTSYFALQGFINIVAPILGSSVRRSREEYATLLWNGMLQANATTYFATKVRVSGAYDGTILTAILIVDSTLYGVHAGTSRVYVKRADKKLYQATRDHLIWPGGKDSKQILYDGGIGGEPGHESLDAFQLHDRWDSVLLCSRSLWKDVPEDEFARQWEQPFQSAFRRYGELDLQQLCDNLIASAKKVQSKRPPYDKILAIQRRTEDATTSTPVCHIPRLIKLPPAVEPLYADALANRDNEAALDAFYDTFKRIGDYCAATKRDQEAQLYHRWLADYSKGRPKRASNPADTRVSLQYGKQLWEQKHYEEALNACEHAIERDPTNAQAYALKGQVLWSLSRLEEALKAYEQASELDPTDALAQNDKGTILSKLKRYEEALRAYEQAIERDPTAVHFHFNKANQLWNLKRHEEALRAYMHVVELDPNHVYAYLRRGQVLAELQRYEEALRAYERAIELYPNLNRVHRDRGQILRNLERYEEALSAYERAIELDPTDALAHDGKKQVLQWLDRSSTDD